jgi:hypothetical protein
MKYIYVSKLGNDANDGASPSNPMRTLAAAFNAVSSDGATILFEGIFEETVWVRGKNHITIGSYGIARAEIHAGMKNGLHFENCCNLRISGVNIKGSGWNANQNGCGLFLNRCTGATVENCDISGFQKSGLMYSGCENLLIRGCYAYRNGSVGIASAGIEMSKNVTIAHCRANDNPGNHRCVDNHSGSGIIVSHTENAVIEYCEAAGNGWAQRQFNHNGPVGIWCWGDTYGIVMRYNIAHHNRTQPGAVDGDGFDIDGGAWNGLMERNYSYSNEAAGYLLCEFGAVNGWKNNDVKCCVSIGDITRIKGYGSVHFYGPENMSMENSRVENSLLIPSSDSYCVANSDIAPSFTGVEIADNVFVTDEKTFTAPVQSHVTAAGNETVNPQACGIDANAPPRILNPRDLETIPLFDLLSENKCAEALKRGGYRALFGKFAEQKANDDKHLFTFNTNERDFEGSDRGGDIALVYDSLKPERSGMAARFCEKDSYIQTYIPASGRGVKYTIRASGRIESGDCAVCLYVIRGENDVIKKYFAGGVSEYAAAEITFESLGVGAMFGIRYEGDSGNFYAGEIDVYKTAETSETRETTAFTTRGNVCSDGNAHCLVGAGSEVFTHVQAPADKKTFSVTVSVKPETITENADSFIFVKANDRTVTQKITSHGTLMMSIPISGGYVTYGAISRSDGETRVTFGEPLFS